MAKYSLLKLQINTSQPSQVASQGGGAQRSHFGTLYLRLYRLTYNDEIRHVNPRGESRSRVSHATQPWVLGLLSFFARPYSRP